MVFRRLKEFYGREDINVGRQKNIDFAKALAIVGMVLVHIMIYPFFGGYEEGFGYFIGYIFGGFMAAPVFMTSMGVGLGYTDKNTPKQIIIRGAKIVGMNYALNVVRSIYCIFGLSIFHENIVSEIFYHVFMGDVLLFAGLAMILFGLLKLIKKHSNLWILVTSIVLIVLSSIFRVMENDNEALAYTVGLFVPVYCGTEPIIYFPLCSWFIFVAVGNALAVTIKKIKNLDVFYIVLGIVGAAMTTALLILDYNLGWQQYFIDNDYVDPEYVVGIGYAIMGLGVVFFEFALFHFICKITPKFLNDIVHKFSSMINEIYIVSWVLILNISYPILLNTIGRESTLWWPYLLSFALIFPISVFLAVLWKKWKIKRKQKKLETNQ